MNGLARGLFPERTSMSRRRPTEFAKSRSDKEGDGCTRSLIDEPRAARRHRARISCDRNEISASMGSGDCFPLLDAVSRNPTLLTRASRARRDHARCVDSDHHQASAERQDMIVAFSVHRDMPVNEADRWFPVRSRPACPLSTRAKGAYSHGCSRRRSWQGAALVRKIAARHLLDLRIEVVFHGVLVRMRRHPRTRPRRDPGAMPSVVAARCAHGLVTPAGHTIWPCAVRRSTS